jgi:Protein of unknown function (DUF1761)
VSEVPDVEIFAVLAATAAAFLIGGAYYAASGEALATASGAPADQEMPPWTLAVELGRCLLIALVVAGLASQGEIDEVAGGLALGLALWVGFPVVLLIGAVVHESTPWRVAAIHSGDWLLKLLAVGVLVSVI